MLLADRAFSDWLLISLFQRKGVDGVKRLHQARKTGTGRVCGRKPQRQGPWEADLWDELPASLELRVAGFRTGHITLVTTLLDEEKYPDAAIAELFRLRWQVEINFRDIKTTLGLDFLRPKIPAMIAKEIHVQAIAYNLVRMLMLEASNQHDLPPTRLSFKSTVSTLRAFAHLFASSAREAAARYGDLLLALAADSVPLRPDRAEPRAVKRRPKVHQLMTKPQRAIRVTVSRRQK